MLFDAVVVSDSAVPDGRTVEFVKDQYRHCKPILILGGGNSVLDKAGIPRTLPSGEGDPGLLVSAMADDQVAASFVKTIAAHRHFARETDPPLV